jgi:hypothetical protein
MRNIITVSIASIALASLTTAAVAKPVVSKTGQVSVDIPEGWDAAAQGDTLLVAGDKKKEIGVIFMITPEEQTAATLAAVAKAMSGAIKNDKWEKPHDITLNGMTGIAMDGTADVKGKPSSTSLLILNTPNKHHVVVFGAVQTDKEAAHAKEIASIVQSLKPTK